MKETYLSRDFRETVAQCFPSQAKELNAFFDARLNALLAENADASKEKRYHLKQQILPGIAAYETLQRIMPKEEALQIVHGYVERLARTSHKQLATLLLIPGLYRLVPGVFVKSTRSVFGPAAGFDPKELQVGNGIWRVDMMKCPYHDTCVAYGCPELCCCFCDSDDISYTGLHPKLIWERSMTLGRGDDRCDFCIGCGSGALTIACAKRNPQGKMVGIDRWGKEYASFSLPLCEKNAAAEGVKNASFRRGNAVKLDFPDGSFDAVTSNYVYHNITGKDKQQLLLETLRVLKKGGTFAIHDLMSPRRYGDMQTFVQKLRDMGYERVELIDTTDGSFMTPKEARCLMLRGSTLLVGRK